MPTILHIITTLERGGAEAMLVKMVGGLAPLGMRSAVVSLTGPGVYGPVLEAMGAPVWSLGLSRALPNPATLMQLRSILRQVQPDLVQTWLYHADLLGLLAARLAGVRPVCWNIRCADMDMSHYSWLTRLLPRLLARLSRQPEAVLVNSQAGLNAHRALGYRPRVWQVIPNGFDTALYRPDPVARAQLRAELGVPDEAPLIGLIARFDPMKDHATFLAAAALLATRRPDARFVLVGRGIEPGNPALAAALGEPLAGRTHLLGARDDVPRIMASLDLGCLSSISESFPNVLGEAMACGVPCVATDVGDSAWILGETGRVAPPRDPAALAAALEVVLDGGPPLWCRLGNAARQRVEETFSLPVIARRYRDVYAGLLAARCHR